MSFWRVGPSLLPTTNYAHSSVQSRTILWNNNAIAQTIPQLPCQSNSTATRPCRSTRTYSRKGVFCSPFHGFHSGVLKISRPFGFHTKQFTLKSSTTCPLALWVSLRSVIAARTLPPCAVGRLQRSLALLPLTGKLTRFPILKWTNTGMWNLVVAFNISKSETKKNMMFSQRNGTVLHVTWCFIHSQLFVFITWFRRCYPLLRQWAAQIAILSFSHVTVHSRKAWCDLQRERTLQIVVAAMGWVLSATEGEIGDATWDFVMKIRTSGLLFSGVPFILQWLTYMFGGYYLLIRSRWPRVKVMILHVVLLVSFRAHNTVPSDYCSCQTTEPAVADIVWHTNLRLFVPHCFIL